MMHESRSEIKELYNYRKTINSLEKKAKIEQQTESSDDWGLRVQEKEAWHLIGLAAKEAFSNSVRKLKTYLS